MMTLERLEQHIDLAIETPRPTYGLDAKEFIQIAMLAKQVLASPELLVAAKWVLESRGRPADNAHAFEALRAAIAKAKE